MKRGTEGLAGLQDPELWRFFAEFCRLETAVGGPDPHMALVGRMSEEQPLPERIWRAGCYIGVYNVPTAEAIWEAWPWPSPLEEGGALEGWVHEHWAGLALRRERRSVRRPDALARFLREYAQFAAKVPQARWAHDERPVRAYLLAWEAVQQVYSLGRYVALKLLEFYGRYCGMALTLPDLRPAGGWSPRTALALLYPEQAEQLLGDDSAPNLRVANALAEEARQRLSSEYGVVLSRYNVQVLLCDFKQAWAGKRQFPGRSQDSEMAYDAAIRWHWGGRSGMWEARAELFPRQALGELGGWDVVREELGDVLREHRYVWSDLLFDYQASKDNLAKPVAWPA